MKELIRKFKAHIYSLYDSVHSNILIDKQMDTYLIVNRTKRRRYK